MRRMLVGALPPLRATRTALAMLAVCATAAAAQGPPNPTQRLAAERESQPPVFRVTVVARTTPAVNYRHRDGATTIDFRGTSLLPDARGEAKVESKQGYIEIEVEFDELEPAAMFGPEYLTYVMWAITPEGRATNLGEVLLNGSESKLNVTTELQMFGLVVTAEPYFAVTQPSDVVVMENAVRSDTRGKVEQVEARYELLKRGTYVMNANPTALRAPKLDKRTPLELHEARNALQLARFAGADEYASETYQKAWRLLQQAEDAAARDKGRKPIVMVAREAVQTAEDARLIALQRQEAERVARAQEAAAQREAQAVARAQAEADRRRAADEERRAAEQARADAERVAREAANQKADADAARLAAERARAEADAASRRLLDEKAAVEAARLDSLAEASRARAEAERARVAAEAMEREKADLRARLQQQLNLVLETHQSARGLIVNMSDVLFDFDRATLRPGAREKLAKVAGILLVYPDLQLEVEGHTDSVGTDDYNDRLSTLRAESVRDFLVREGISADSIMARGVGETRPVVSNDTAEGRQQNRRVELVVSGESIENVGTSSRR